MVARARWVRGALLIAVALSSWLVLGLPSGGNGIPPAWPAAGLGVGALLLAAERRTGTLLWVAAIVTAAGWLRGAPWAAALAVGVTCAVQSWLVVSVLRPRDSQERPALLRDGDVSRAVKAIALGSAFASASYAALAVALDRGDPLLAAVEVFGTHAAALMILLPFFARTPTFPPLASRGERTTQWCVTLATAVVLFVSADAPPAVFVVMPMFAWLGFRGTLREASALLCTVAVVATLLTSAEVGPVWGLSERYGLASELMTGYLQLFLLDCGLILLPLSVAVNQQRVSAAQAAADKETLERLVASATGTAIVAVDLEGRVTLFNPGAEAMLGYPAQEAVGTLADRFFAPGEIERVAREVGSASCFGAVGRAVALSGQSRRLWSVRDKAGADRILSMNLAEIPDASGAVIGLLCTGEDVTEREQMQQALMRTLQHQQTAVDRLEELDRIKTQFISTVSHELRTPITSVVGYSQLLCDGLVGELTAPQREMVNRVGRNSRRLLGLIEDLLTLSHIESVGLRSAPVTGDLRSAVQDAVEAVLPEFAHRSISLRVSLPDGPVDFRGDPCQLERMMVNLVTNAVKFTPDGGEVRVEMRSRGPVVDIVVADTGMGIPLEEQDQLFTRFFRSTLATEHAIQGTGLGLTIVKAIVNLHAGTISVSSTPGVGTTVHVALPRGTEAADGRPQAASAPRKAG